jgi:hypothetical protein
MATMVSAKAEGNTRMQARKIYSLADLESALRTCNHAVIQTRRGQGGPILDELKNDAEALTGLVARARAETGNALSFHDSGDLLPKLAYWHQQRPHPLPSRSEIIKTHEGLP